MEQGFDANVKPNEGDETVSPGLTTDNPSTGGREMEVVKVLKKKSLGSVSQEMDIVSKFRGGSVRVSPDVRPACELFFSLKLASWEEKKKGRESVFFFSV